MTEGASQQRITGYTHVTKTSQSETNLDVNINYQDHFSIKIHTTSGEDSVSKTTYKMDPSFQYKYSDLAQMLTWAFPPRFQEGNLHGQYLSAETSKKIDNQWRVTNKQSDRKDVPYGFEYETGYSHEFYCPNLSYEYNSKGEWNNNEWIRTLDVTIHDCQNGPIEYWREVHNYDQKRQNTLLSLYVRKGDLYELEFQYTYKYDEQGRQIERTAIGDYPEPEKAKKWFINYDEKGNPLYKKYTMEGQEWVETYKTINERTADGGYLYTMVNLINGAWTNSWREKILYNADGNIVEWYYEVWNQDLQLWKRTFYAKNVYFPDGRVIEEFIYSFDSTFGFKDIYEFDENKEIKASKSFECNSDEKCAQDIYTPTYKAYFNNNGDNDLDYLATVRFIDEKWLPMDSLVNRYNHNNEILESYSISHDYYQPQQVSFEQKFVYRYEPFVVTGIERESDLLNVYPNPTKGLVRLKGAIESVLIFDTQGQNMRLKPIYSTEDDVTIDMSLLPAGIYFLKTQSQNSLQVYKIVRE